MPGIVRAAGAIIRRQGEGGGPELLLVHRPRYDDWTFPKGKAEPGESDEDTAAREVEEETGLRCRLGDRLGTTSYRDSRGRPKTVVYFACDAGTVEPWPQNEVDAVRWLTIDEALSLLSYEHDRDLLHSVADQLG